MAFAARVTALVPVRLPCVASGSLGRGGNAAKPGTRVTRKRPNVQLYKKIHSTREGGYSSDDGYRSDGSRAVIRKRDIIGADSIARPSPSRTGGGGGGKSGAGGGGGGGGSGGGGGGDSSESRRYDFTLMYAALLTAGGFAGYAKAQSVKSLAFSLGAVALLMAAGLIGFEGAGLPLALAVGGGLMLFMGKRFVSSKKFMPSGLISAASMLYVISMLSA